MKISIVFDHFFSPFSSFNQKVIIQGIKFKGNSLSLVSPLKFFQPWLSLEKGES